MHPLRLLPIVWLLGGGAGALAAPAVFSDGTFADADWSVTTFTTGDGGTVEAAQDTTGNPAPSRRIRDVVNAAPSPSTFSAILGAHIRTGLSYDPSQGAIASIDYFEDARLVQGFGDGEATGIALLQGGKIYIRQVGTTPDQTWTRKSALGVVASGLVRLADSGAIPTEHPDFSIAGAPIEFGFYRSNSTANGASGYEIIALIDNWTVLVNTPCTGDGDCVYPDACFTGACVAGACRATAAACDDGDPCTTDVCIAGTCSATPIECDDGDACTTDACTAGSCTATPLDCDDGLSCTLDTCSGGTCEHGLGFDTIEAAIDGLRALLETPPCAGDGIAKRPRRKLVAKLVKARKKLVLADAATRARLVSRLIGNAGHLLDLAAALVARAESAGVVTTECGASVRSYLAGVATCVDGLPGG